MVVRHPGEVQTADQVIDTECVHEAFNVSDAVIWIPHNEAILTQRFQGNRSLIL